MYGIPESQMLKDSGKLITVNAEYINRAFLSVYLNVNVNNEPIFDKIESLIYDELGVQLSDLATYDRNTEEDSAYMKTELGEDRIIINPYKLFDKTIKGQESGKIPGIKSLKQPKKFKYRFNEIKEMSGGSIETVDSGREFLQMALPQYLYYSPVFGGEGRVFKLDNYLYADEKTSDYKTSNPKVQGYYAEYVEVDAYGSPAQILGFMYGYDNLPTKEEHDNFVDGIYEEIDSNKDFDDADDVFNINDAGGNVTDVENDTYVEDYEEDALDISSFNNVQLTNEKKKNKNKKKKKNKLNKKISKLVNLFDNYSAKKLRDTVGKVYNVKFDSNVDLAEQILEKIGDVQSTNELVENIEKCILK